MDFSPFIANQLLNHEMKTEVWHSSFIFERGCWENVYASVCTHAHASMSPCMCSYFLCFFCSISTPFSLFLVLKNYYPPILGNYVGHNFVH
uniref:Uncharacterized protein n=1 Tax=Anguilla anguilla TaxID=7936 RepID=A0A0E9X889_ANGAN